jgi:hypothetical protein
MHARLAFLLLIALASSAAAQTRTIPSDTVIRLQRTSCLGTCPAYTVTIDAGGVVTYEGDSHVRVVGRQTSRIAPASLTRLLEVAERIRFFGLRDTYEESITDLPTTYVTITAGGRTKKIKDYYGAPAGLKELEDAIDAAARTKRWIFLEDDTLDALVASSWSADTPEGIGLLLEAVRRDDVPTARRLIELGARVSDWSRAPLPTPPLYLARSVAMVELLAGAGADPNERNGNVQLTALMIAVFSKSAGVAKALVKAGARLEEIADGHTALYQAACAGRLSVVKVLLAAGAGPRGSTDIPAVQCARTAYANEVQLRTHVRPDVIASRPPLDDYRAVIELLEQAEQRR